MPIDLNSDVRDEAVASIQRYFEEHMEERIGNLGAGMLLDFFVEELGPSIYNQAIADVQERLQARILEVDVELHQDEFPYWWKHGQARR